MDGSVIFETDVCYDKTDNIIVTALNTPKDDMLDIAVILNG